MWFFLTQCSPIGDQAWELCPNLCFYKLKQYEIYNYGSSMKMGLLKNNASHDSCSLTYSSLQWSLFSALTGTEKCSQRPVVLCGQPVHSSVLSESIYNHRPLSTVFSRAMREINSVVHETDARISVSFEICPFWSFHFSFLIMTVLVDLTNQEFQYFM